MMTSSMIKVLTWAAVFVWLLPPFSAFAYDTIDIDVAPKVLNLQSQGKWITVHTNLLYSMVQEASVSLNGVDIAWSKADAQGYFVAKFQMNDIKDLPFNLNSNENEITLTGTTTSAETFVGTQTIWVIDVLPRRR